MKVITTHLGADFDALGAAADADVVVEEIEATEAVERRLALDEGARTLLGRPTPCVGRERELVMLEGYFAECVADDVARVVLGPDMRRGVVDLDGEGDAAGDHLIQHDA